MRVFLLIAVLLTLPMAGWAQDVPVYQQEGKDLIYTGETMALKDAIKITGLTPANFAFEPPTFMANNRGTYIPVFAEPWEYESVLGADGVIEGEPDDLVFEESEGLNVRDDLVFGENEGLNTRDDLTFGKNEGIDTREDMTFSEREGTDTRDDMTFGENEGLNTRDDLTFDESEGTKVTDDLVFTEDDALKEVAAEDGPIEKLKGAYGASVTPQDGQWTVMILEASAIGCPPGAEQAARSKVMSMRSLDVTFSKPKWHPADLSPDLGQYSWREIGQNGYFSYPYATGPEAEGSGISLAVSAAYVARSPTFIETWYRVRVNLAPHLAAMAGSSEKCEVIMLGELNK